MEEARTTPHPAPSSVTGKPLQARQTSSQSNRPQSKRLTSNRASQNPFARTIIGSDISQRPTGAFKRLDTRYMEMLLSLDKIPRIHNILASFFGWLVLAGFVVFPGTFTSIKDLPEDPGLAGQASDILDHVQNIPLLIVAAVCRGIGALGLLWLVFRWRRNYVWLLNRIFLPGATNALAGFISTLMTVYSQKDGNWSVMATVTGVVEVVDLVVCGVLFLLSTLLLKRIKWKHGNELNKLEHRDEGLLEKAGRKVQEPAMEPQSVV